MSDGVSLSVLDIQRAVCLEFNIDQIEMTSDRRAKVVARPRQVAMYLAKRLTRQSLPAIGRSFAKKDHTTVMWAVKRIATLITEDPIFGMRVTALEARLISPELVEHY
jgi:chromosomal replication initiator protein